MPESLYPSLYGDAPGDADVPKGEDITGARLKPLSDPGPDSPIGSGSQVGRTMQSFNGDDPRQSQSHPLDPVVQQQQQYQEQPQQQQQQADQQQSGNRRTAADRIRQVVGQRNEAQQENEQLRRELDDLKSQLSRGPQYYQQPAPAPAQAQMSAYDALMGDSSQEGAVQQAPAVNPVALESVVQRAVAPLVERLNRYDSQTRRNDEHAQSFVRATQSFPELNDPNSAARQLFNETYADALHSPMGQLPNAPEQIALMVRGAMAEDMAAHPRAPEPQRMAAQVHTPTPMATAPEGLQQRQQAEKVFSEAAARLRGGDSTFDTYKAARLAGARAGRTRTGR